MSPAVLDALDEESDERSRLAQVDRRSDEAPESRQQPQARKALATELKYQGDKSDSAKMNVWLHKQVMTKLAENGGRRPERLASTDASIQGAVKVPG